MSSPLPKLALVLLFVAVVLHKSDGEDNKEWCITHEQCPPEVVQESLEWACNNGANCSNIQRGGSCYHPNTLKDRASYAFNNYYQNFKAKGATCWFHGAAVVTQFDPSHGACQFEFIRFPGNNAKK